MCELVTVSRLVQEAAEALGCDVEDVRKQKYDHYGLKIFSTGGEEYTIGSDDEATEAVKQYILDSVWSFRPEFIASHTKAGASNGMIRAIEALQKDCDSCNEDIKGLIEDIDSFVEDAVSADGRGTFLSPYDSNEQEIVIDCEYFYAYRIG